MAPCCRSPTPPPCPPSSLPPRFTQTSSLHSAPYISTSSLCSRSVQNHSFPPCLFAPLQIFFAFQLLLPNPSLSPSRLFYDSPYNPIFSLFSSYLSLCSTEIPVFQLFLFSAPPFSLSVVFSSGPTFCPPTPLKLSFFFPTRP